MEKDNEEKQKHSEDKLHELLLIKEKNLRRQQEINKVKNKKIQDMLSKSKEMDEQKTKEYLMKQDHLANTVYKKEKRRTFDSNGEKPKKNSRREQKERTSIEI